MWTRALKLVGGVELDTQRYADGLDSPRKKYGKYARNIVVFQWLIGTVSLWLPWHFSAGREKWCDKDFITLGKRRWDFDSLIFTQRENQQKSVWLLENQTMVNCSRSNFGRTFGGRDDGVLRDDL